MNAIDLSSVLTIKTPLASRRPSTNNPRQPRVEETLALRGVVNANPKGFGFVTTPEGDEHFIPPSEMRRLVPGDTIEFTLRPGKHPDAVQAAPRGIVERPETVWVGIPEEYGGEWHLRCEADAPCFCTLVLPDLGYVAAGQFVSVRVPALAPAARPHRLNSRVPVKLERILGSREGSGFLADFALARFDFPVAFSAATLREAEVAAAESIEVHDRQDLRDLPFVTIDGESTRDYDDAIYVRKNEQGFEVLVAIADVAHYVKPGSELDLQAKVRGTSVYLPSKVVPMLPEALSNGACSLVPQSDRYAVVARLQLSAAGDIQETHIGRAVVRSAARLTYKQVQSWKDAPETEPLEMSKVLGPMWEVFELCDAIRTAGGKMRFETPEPKLMPTEDGSVHLEWEARTEAHRLVEELMLLANRAVAMQLAKRTSAFFRHQPQPATEDWEKLQAFALSRGVELQASPSMAAIAQLVSNVEEHDAFKAELQARQTMEAAVYDALEHGHFSLNFEAYTHFSSPIRRYADLVVHRILVGDIDGDAADLASLAALCTRRAKAARSAERFVWDNLKKQALWDGQVTAPCGVASYVVTQSRRGIRVVSQEWQASMFLEARQMTDAGARHDADAEAWVLDGKVLELGELLQVEPLGLESSNVRLEIIAGVALKTPAPIAA